VFSTLLQGWVRVRSILTATRSRRLFLLHHHHRNTAQLWLYKYYGDTHTMREAYNVTKAYVELLDAAPLSAIEGGLGDWMPAQGTSTKFTGLGFQRMSYRAFANISTVLGEDALAKVWSAKADAVDASINKQFLDAATGVYAAATSAIRADRHNASAFFHVALDTASIANTASDSSSQCGQGMALFMDIVPPASRDAALAVMAANARAASGLSGACRGGDFGAQCTAAAGGPGAHMTAGLFGIKWFLMALADGGMNDLAYETLSAPSYPSFKWMFHNDFANATTLWESWFFSDNTFSHNHPMFASSEVWMVQSVGGLQPHPAAKGMDKILIKPSPPTKLDHASLSYRTARGVVRIDWAASAKGGDGDARAITLNIVVPPNVVATVHVPSRAGSAVHESGTLVLGGRRETGSLVLEIGSGEHAFTSTF
jgi:alpha-L-rhamnosidase